jgi:hypothetical protein
MSTSSVELLVCVEMLKMREDVIKVKVEVSTMELLASAWIREVFVAKRVVLALFLRVRQNRVC